MATLTVRRFEEAALLRALGYRFVNAEIGESGRAILLFEDPQGKAREVVAAHAREGVSVNSLVFEEALRWAKDRVFAARREGGLT